MLVGIGASFASCLHLFFSLLDFFMYNEGVYGFNAGFGHVFGPMIGDIISVYIQIYASLLQASST